MNTTSELALEITGMHCNGCVNSLSKALQRVDSVEVKQVVIGSATVAFDPARATEQDIFRAVEKAGFQARKSD
ncbi:MAG: heavy-metal-associated domain-containing protein [Bryobacterales bacterium]|nr:heavy-metal-associated domain-containing protein [Bryobacterales bacterium]